MGSALGETQTVNSKAHREIGDIKTGLRVMGGERRMGNWKMGWVPRGCLRLPGLGEVQWPLSCHPETVILPLGYCGVAL